MAAAVIGIVVYLLLVALTATVVVAALGLLHWAAGPLEDGLRR